MLIHGLNQRPSSWDELINVCRSLGLHVYRLSLKGHRGRNFQDMHTVSAEIWLNDFNCAYHEATTRYPKLPLFLIGYSMGALVAAVSQLKRQTPLFSKQILLAPAFSLRNYTHLVLPLTWFLPFLPSAAHGHYLANREGTTSSAYRSLFQLLSTLHSFHHFHVLNIPTQLIMRTTDELVSYRGTKRFIANHDLDKWEIAQLYGKGMHFSGRRIRHLMVDSQSMGQKSWNWMMKRMRRFLLGKKRKAPNQEDDRAVPLAWPGGPGNSYEDFSS